MAIRHPRLRRCATLYTPNATTLLTLQVLPWQHKLLEDNTTPPSNETKEHLAGIVDVPRDVTPDQQNSSESRTRPSYHLFGQMWSHHPVA